MVNESLFLETLISISVLLLAAKLLSEGFYRLKLPPLVGQILAGVVFGPYAVGGLVQIDGRPLVAPNEIVEQLGQLSAIIILFVAGMKITPKEFFAKGAAEFSIGTLGLIIPCVLGILVFSSYGFGTLESLIIATALSATSIAVSLSVPGAQKRAYRRIKAGSGRRDSRRRVGHRHIIGGSSDDSGQCRRITYNC